MKKRISWKVLLGNEIYRMRRAKNISQKKLASKAGASEDRIARLEKGELIDPPIGLLRKVARSLNCRLYSEHRLRKKTLRLCIRDSFQRNLPFNVTIVPRESRK